MILFRVLAAAALAATTLIAVPAAHADVNADCLEGIPPEELDPYNVVVGTDGPMCCTGPTVPTTSAVGSATM